MGSTEMAPAVVSNVVPLRRDSAVQEVAPAPAAVVKPEPPKAQQTVRKAPQELVKVSADLLDNLVNLAGETSIGRGRLEQQVTTQKHLRHRNKGNCRESDLRTKPTE